MSCNITYISSKPKYRISVPKALKDRLWDLTFGQNAGQGKCDVCDTTINSKRFEAGHIKSVYHGGSTTLDNLKCICSTCNKSMGTRNLEEFKKTYFPAICKKIKKQHNKCECCCHNIIELKAINNLTSYIIPEKEIIYEKEIIPDKEIINNKINKVVEFYLDNDEDKESHKKKLNIKLDELFNKFVYIPSAKLLFYNI
jgi:5-methylcytosine-specific restriction endonuclease McrA